VTNRAGSDGQFKGNSTIGGMLAPNDHAHEFMVWADDDTSAGAGTCRVRVWWEAADGKETVVYDSGVGQAIGGGSIVVHAAQ
jgi:hypothetical protein